MSGSIYKAGAGAILQQMRLDIYSNNLANVNTVGYKADQPVFRLDQAETGSAGSFTMPAVLSPYATPLESATNFNPGPLQKTGNPLDAAIVGKGFFEVQSPEGTQYTRNGRFNINEEGILSTSEGWPVMGQGGEIAISGHRVEINDQGDVIVDGNVTDALRVVEFPEPYDLRKTGSSLFQVSNPDVRPQQAQDYRISQGAVESSNVNAIRTMTEMIETIRVFQSYQKVISAVDEATGKTVNEVGRSA